jgi:molecular chaperone DnaK
MPIERVIVGIDLGTTFSAIAIVNEHGQPQIIADSQGNRTIPSVIFFDPGGPPLVGHNAKAMAASEPERVVQFVKREMGNPDYLFTVDAEDEGWSAPELSALILRRLKKNAEEFLGKTVTDAIITVPAYFRDDQRSATIEAGQIAGLNVLEIINEPTAAALAYGYNNMETRRRILVYDLGGGTFDVTILEIDKGLLRVIATDGNAELGGKDFDDRILQSMFESFEAEHGIDLSDRLEVVGDWRDKAEKMKVRLSELKSVRERLSFEGKTTTLELSRDRFMEMTSDLVSLTEDLVNFTVDKADMTWSEVGDVLLVGGSTRMPMISELIERISGKKPIRSINPDDAVALGAALKGWLATSTLESLPGDAPVRQDNTGALPPPPITIQDVTAHSLGIVTINHTGQLGNSIILPKNTTIPASREKLYTTSSDAMTAVSIRVSQGEDQDLDFCRVVGEFVLGPIPPRPKGESRIRVILSYDKNSNVKVSAIDEASGKSIVKEISAHDIKSSPAVLETRRNRVDTALER